MKKNLFNKFWLRVGMIVAVMTTALAGTVKGESETLTFSDKYTANYSLDGKTVSGTNFSIAFDKNGGTAPQYYTNGTAVRAYAKNKFTVSSSYTITGIELTFGTGDNGGTTGNTITTDVETYSDGTWEGSATSVTFTIGGSSGHRRIAGITVTYTSGGSQTETVATPTISGDESFLTSTQVSIDCATTGATIQYSTNNGTSWTNYTAPFTLTETTTVQAKATKSGMTDSGVATKTFTKVTPLANIAALTAETTAGTYYVALSNAVVTYVNGNNAYIQDASGAVAMYKSEHGLTAGDVLSGTATVTYQVRNANPQITNLSGVTPVSGTAPEPTTVAASDWDYTFNNVLSQYFKITGATVTQSNGKYYVSLGGESVQLYKPGTAPSINTDYTYTIVGFPTLYNSTKELQIYEDPEAEESTEPIISLESTTISLAYDATSGEIAYTIENSVAGAALTATSSASWISNITVGASSVTFTTTANDGTSDREATITLSYTGAENKVVTVTQGHYVADFATLPFEFDGGQADIAEKAGLTHEGIDASDYGSSPKLKFNHTGDYLILHFNERPGILTFDVKGNPGGNPSVWAGTFKVQTSTDGTTFTDLETYDDLTTTVQSESFNNLGENVRYIKWIYTNKSSGNVALGNISLDQYGATQTYTLSWTAGEHTELFVFDEEDDSEPLTSGVSVAEGTTIYVSVGADEGYEISALTVKDANNSTIALSEEGENYYSFEMPASNVTITTTAVASVTPPTPVEGGDYVRITSLDKLADGRKVIIAARYDEDHTSYYAMPNETSGRPVGVAFTSVTSGNCEALSADITASEDTYYWTVNVTNDGYTFMNANNQMIGYTNGTNFATGGNNTAWTITSETAAASAMVDGYTGFVIRNGNTNSRAFAFNGTAFGAYATTNMSAPGYNFFLDFFVQAQVVTVSAAGYATFVANADLEIPEDVEVYAVQVNGAATSAHLEPITGGIPQGEAVLVKASAGSYGFLYATEEVDDLTIQNDLVAATAAVTANGSQYCLAQFDGVGFYKVQAGVVIPAGKAYLQVTSSAGQAKAFYGFDDDATGIETIDNGQLTTDNGVIYNLAGQRLQKMQRGINIVNGKKILK